MLCRVALCICVKHRQQARQYRDLALDKGLQRLGYENLCRISRLYISSRNTRIL